MDTAEAPSTTRGLLAPRWRRDALFLAVAILVLAMDQASKHAVRAFMDLRDFYPSSDWPVRFHYVTNTGAAFGILENQTGFLALTSLIGVAAILLYYWFPPFNHWVVPAAMGMMLGGAVGNLSDRIRLGEVTDFIDFPRYPSFNVADASIVVALAALLIAYALIRPERPRPATAHGPRPATPDPLDEGLPPHR
jgi:signal peptidase II